MEIHYRAIGSYVNRYGIKVYVLPYNCRHNWQLVFLNRTKGLYSCIKEIKPDIIFYHNFIERDVRSVVRYAKEHSSVEVYVDSHNDYINTPVKGFWAGRRCCLLGGMRELLHLLQSAFGGHCQ